MNKYVCVLSKGLFLDDYKTLIEWGISPSQLKDKIFPSDSLIVSEHTSNCISYGIESKLFDSHNTFAISFNYIREKMKSVNIWQKETKMPLYKHFEEMQIFLESRFGKPNCALSVKKLFRDKDDIVYIWKRKNVKIEHQLFDLKSRETLEILL